jgi:hypothetical protein
MNHDQIRVMTCPCCSNTMRVTEGNFGLIIDELDRRYPDGANFDIGCIPKDLDLTGPLTAEDITRLVGEAAEAGGAA